MSNLQKSNPEPPTPDNFELELLKQEYFFIQNTIEDYNKQIWAIKALGIAATGTVLSLMLNEKTNITKSAIADWLCHTLILLDTGKSVETLPARLLSPCG